MEAIFGFNWHDLLKEHQLITHVMTVGSDEAKVIKPLIKSDVPEYPTGFV